MLPEDSLIWVEIRQLKKDLARLQEKKKVIEEVASSLQDVHEKGREALDKIGNAMETLREVYSEDNE